MHEVSEKMFWPNSAPDSTSDDHSVVTSSGNEFCTEVIGTEKWVKDYENCGENNEQVVCRIAPKDTDGDSHNRVVIS